MLLSKSCRLVLLALPLAGCGPDVNGDSDWMLGTFSSTNVRDRTVGLASVTHYEFRDDGTLTLTALRACGENREEFIREYQWRRDGDSVIVDIPEPENTVFQTWIITLGEDCNALQVDEIQNGDSKGGPTLWRGAVCMKDLPPCEPGTSCSSCETLWCDEPPPACEEE